MDPILQALIDMILRMIANNETHTDYKRTVDLAETYQILATGKGIEKLLQRFIKRESAEDFDLRCQITNSITPAVFSSIQNPFFKVTRNERIKKSITIGKKSNEKKIQKMIEGFFGSGRAKDKGLDYYLKTRKFNTSFLDPNAWIVVEWKGVGPQEIPLPYPFEIDAKNALNFEIINDEVQWLFCDMDIKFRTSTDATKAQKEGKKFTLYHTNYTIVFEQVDRKFLEETGYNLEANQSFQEIKKGAKTFLCSVFEPKIGYPPAFRIGYKPDLETKARTFVAPWHAAMAFFMKSLKAVSELDLTMSGHVFPQKIQYAPPCPGEGKGRTCNKGYIKGSEEQCTNCKGTGYLTHSAANDVLYLPMPDVEAQHVFELENLLVYKSPPVELIEFQKDYVLQLKAEAFEAVFNSQMFVKKENGGEGGSAAKTAFEIDTNMQSIYDTLEAYTEKDSEIWREVVTVFAILCGEALDKIDIRHNFPADFKLKTQDMLLADLQNANNSDAPAFLRDSINLDLAEIVYAGDPIGLEKYKVQRRFFPFNGKSQDEIALLISSEYVSRREKVLYGNYTAIFTEIEAEHPEFYILPTFDAQFEILEAKLREWMDAIEEEKPKLSVSPLKDAAGGPGIPEEEETEEEVPTA